MNTLIYVSHRCVQGDKLTALANRLFPKGELIIVRELENLKCQLSVPNAGFETALLVTSTSDEFIRVFNMRHLLEGLRLILVLPDIKGVTALGHVMRPRFMTRLPLNLWEMEAVLGRLCNQQPRHEARGPKPKGIDASAGAE